MEALSVLMPLMQMGMSGAQSTLNTGLGLIPTALSLWDRFQARHDPVMRRISEVIGHRYNQAVTENPYGDAYGSWGGMFGTNDAGQPIGVGEAQARATAQLMNENPAASGIANYQQLATQQRPGVVDSTSGLASLMGHESQFTQPYQQPTFVPEAPDMSAALNTDFSGSPAPRDTSEYQYDPRLGTLTTPQAVAYNTVDALGQLTPQGADNLGTIAGAMRNRVRRSIIQPLQRPRTGGGTPATPGFDEHGWLLKSNTAGNNAPTFPEQPFWSSEATKLGPAPKFGRITQPGSGGRAMRPADGLLSLGQMFIGQPRRF